jgi:hypothetical protein
MCVPCVDLTPGLHHPEVIHLKGAAGAGNGAAADGLLGPHQHNCHLGQQQRVLQFWLPNQVMLAA